MKKILLGIAILIAPYSYGQTLQEQEAYIKAEAALKSGEYIRAGEYYSVIDRKSLSPEEIELQIRKLAHINLDSIIDTCRADKAFIDAYIARVSDSTDADTKKVKQVVDSYYTNSNYSNTIYTDPSGIPHLVSNARGAGSDMIPCAYPWIIGDRKNADFYLRTALKCLSTNPVSYSKPVKEYTLCYLRLLKAISTQEMLMQQSQYHCTEVSDYSYFYRKVNGLQQYPRPVFLKAVDSVMQQYTATLDLVYIEKQCRDTKLAIDSLNLGNKKKILYPKFLLAYNGDMANLQASDNLAYQGTLLGTLLAFCLKIESLWPTDTGELEKQLNNAVSAEQVRAVVMK